MHDISCIIIEDEPLAAKVLSDYVSQVPFLKLKGVFKDAILATEYLLDHQPDLLFLDIHLPRLKGMAFLKTLTYTPSVIVTTAYHQYAVEGFTLNVTDYLLKPFEFDRFLIAVNKVKAGQLQKQKAEEPRDYFFINFQKKKIRISFADIIYIESQQEYVKIVTDKKTFFPKLTTSDMEEMLPSNLFKRIHRSYIVAVSRIDSFTAESVEVNGISIPIGRSYRGIFDHL